MDKVIAVARREFLATVRTKAFILSVVMMPGLIVIGIFGGRAVERMALEEQRATRRVAVVDQAGDVLPHLSWQVEAYNQERPNQRFELEPVAAEADDAAVAGQLADRVRRGELYAYILIASEAVTGEAGAVLARQDNQLQVGQRLESWIREAVIAARLARAQIDPRQIHELRERPIPVTGRDVATGAPVTENRMARALLPFAFMFLLFMGTFGIAQGLLTSLIEEKGSRIIEVLLSAVSPTQLLAGKVLGLAGVGFLLLGVWGAVGYLAAQKYQVAELVTGYRLTLAALYFVPGFLLIASLMAAIGSACNELKEAQSMVFPISLLTIIPMIFWFYLSEHPDAAFSIALSYVPPITPFVMILRICADPGTPPWQIVSTLVLLWVAVIVAIWAAGKVFRVGVLMYGKPPTLGELVRWVRYT